MGVEAVSKIKCRLISSSNAPHLQQLYAGFLILHRNGIIDLEQQISKQEHLTRPAEYHLRDAWRVHLSVVVDDKLKLHYDTHDSWEIDEEQLANSDFYFKRTFKPGIAEKLGAEGRKLRPLGLNYAVLPNGPDGRALRRSICLSVGRQRIIDIIRSLSLPDPLIFAPRLRKMWSLPEFDAPPKALFVTGAWDPHDNPQRPPESVREIHGISEARAECLRLLRKELGDRFFGGFARSPYALKHYGDLVIPDCSLGTQGNYLKLMKQYPICVTTVGLHGSVGWKLAEYVAFGKAIVTEKLNCVVPGDFSKDANYLEFSTPQECVEKVKLLLADAGLRRQMMANNAAYYHSFLRPDRLILNSIMTALTAC